MTFFFVCVFSGKKKKKPLNSYEKKRLNFSDGVLPILTKLPFLASHKNGLKGDS